MELSELIKTIKINLGQGIIEPDSGSGVDYQFDISPKEFLSYSKQDFKASDKGGNVNALTNAKRAIDCQVDKVFNSLGIDPNNFPSAIEEFVSKSKNAPLKKDLPLRLRFLQAMSFAPAEIISNARLLRHKLEHYYRKPSDEEVSNAIDLAELFILATDSKLKSIWDFSITDEDKYSKNGSRLWDSVYVTYDSNSHAFDIKGYIGTDRYEQLQIMITNIEFYYLLKIATSFDYEFDVQDAVADLIEVINHPIPKQNVKFRVI